MVCLAVTVSEEEHAKIRSGLRAAQEKRLGKEGAGADLPRTLVEIQVCAHCHQILRGEL